MNHLSTLVTDLALILGIAAIISIVFKLLKQPPVLGYIVAGFIASSHVTFTPSVVDQANVQTWAEIGVIFLLFALGLDFSFKKLIKTGPTAIIASTTIILGMVLLGFMVGSFLGWKTMDCMFLGGMIAMSSTSIIYKALNDLNLHSRSFAPLVLGILVIEDIVAIILMVLLSTIAVKNNFEGFEMLQSIGKLLFFLVLWITVGIYLIPTFFKHTRKIMNDETLTILSIGLCLGMVVIAAETGFSAALGAFVMGSILAETIEAEKIESLIRPIKDLFGAIFFVSVGMMVDPVMIINYAWPIFIITITILIGQTVFGTFGVLLSGQPLKTALECGFCLTQIGEFSFIIAALGITLNVTEAFLYPIVVAVSVITTFITPYKIKATEPVFLFLNKWIPRKWKNFMDRYSSGTDIINHTGHWKLLLIALIRITIVYSVIIIGVLVIAMHMLVPFIQTQYPGIGGRIVSAIIVIIAIAPFLRAIVAKKNHSPEFQSLWNDRRFNRGYLVSLIAFRFFIAVGFVTYIIAMLFPISIALLMAVAGVIVTAIFYSRYLKKQSIVIERRFLNNFNVRHQAHENQISVPKFAKHLLARDLHLYNFTIPINSLWIGRSLSELSLKTHYGVQIVAIMRGDNYYNIPGGDARFFPMDRIQVIGNDEQIQHFQQALACETRILTESDQAQSDIELRQIVIDHHSSLIGKNIVRAGIREHYQCLIVGVERAGRNLIWDQGNVCFEEDDVLWLVGNIHNIYKLIDA